MRRVVVTILCILTTAITAAAAPPDDVVLTFEAADGVPLEAKLSLPAGHEAPVPVVFYLHGAGVRSFDNPFRYQDENGEVSIGRYLDFHATELTRRGVAFFRMSKRGCTAVDGPPWLRLDREVFSGATFNVLLDDYTAALEVLREHDGIDPERILFMGSSEGTRLAPLLAARSPRGVRGLALIGYAQDNAHDTLVWQMSAGPWRNIQHMIPAARDGALTRDEHATAIEENPNLAAALPFDALDANRDGDLTSEDLESINVPRLQAILQAVEERNDDLLWTHLLNLSSGYLLDWWDAPPNQENLLALDVPIAIYHGALDGTCRVEGVHETEAAFQAAGRDSLHVFIDPVGDHDVNWTWQSAREGGPPAYRHAFEWIEKLLMQPVQPE